VRIALYFERTSLPTLQMVMVSFLKLKSERMKNLALKKLPYLVLVLCLSGCGSVQPEEKAAYIGSADLAFCGACGGWFVTVDSIKYRANVPESYRAGNQAVWLRFQKDESDGSKKHGNWIIISSIRPR
jgi:hypothetical protein